MAQPDRKSTDSNTTVAIHCIDDQLCKILSTGVNLISLFYHFMFTISTITKKFVINYRYNNMIPLCDDVHVGKFIFRYNRFVVSLFIIVILNSVSKLKIALIIRFDGFILTRSSHSN